MKQKSVLTRCLALALALLLAVSSANLGLVSQVFAAEPGTVAVSTLIANNYDLSDAEKALITSGYLAGTNVTYTPFAGDGLVSVDTGTATIKAADYEGWVPTYAEIESEGEVKEEVTLTDGEGTYAFGGNAFSVKVYYKLEVEVDIAAQQTMLDAAANLKKGLADMAAVYSGTDAYIGNVVEAMPSLEMLAEGFDAMNRHFGFKEDAKAAVLALKAEMNANDGQLNLQVENAAYDSAASKTAYLAQDGIDYKTAIKSTYANLSAIANDGIMTSDTVDYYMEDEGYGTAWGALKSNLGTIIAALEPVANAAAWDTSALSVASVDAGLDALLATIETTTAATAKNPLLVDTVFVRENLSMNNVNIIVNWHTASTEPDDAVDNWASAGYYTVWVLPTGATAEQLKAAVAEVEAEAAAFWAEEGFDATYLDRAVSVIPDALTEDLEIVVDYTPKSYTVDYCGEELILPYGYNKTLEKHEISAKAYDYTVNGEAKNQGDVIVITGDTTIARTEVKAYETADLYTLVGNATDAYVKAILTSRAIKGNETIRYHQPDTSEADELLTLVDGTLTAQASYASDYKGLSWVPYTYGDENSKSFFSGNTAAWNAKYANVTYALDLTAAIGLDRANEIRDLAADIRAEADGQVAALNRLDFYYDDIASLDKTKLGALNGVIDVTDLNADPAKNEELKAYFKSIVSEIINTRLSGSNLTLKGMLDSYSADGLMYYYKNYADIIDEVGELSRLMTAMTADDDKEAALTILTSAAGYPTYAEKIVNLGTAMAEIKEGLSVPNDAIDLESANLGKLIDAYLVDIPAAETTVEKLLVVSPELVAADETVVYAQATVYIGSDYKTFSTPAVEKGQVAEVAAMLDRIAAFVAETVGAENVQFYTEIIDGDDLTAYVDQAMNDRPKAVYTYEPTEYTVNVDYVGTQYITIENTWINLPYADPSDDYAYDCTIGDTVVRAASYKFSAQEIAELFVNNDEYTVSVEFVDKVKEEFDGALDDLQSAAPAGTSYEIERDEDGYVTGITANVAAAQNDITSFAMGFINLGYDYIAINNVPFLYLNEEDTLEVSLQTLVDAILNDEEFGSHTLIDLGLNNKGQFLKATMQLGRSTTEGGYEILHDVAFVLNLTNAPSQMVTVANGLNAVKNYMYFNSNDGVMDVTLNLPEKVYEAYVTALLATGELDKTDVNAIDNQIAFEFLWDYLEIVKDNPNITATTFENTLDRLDNALNDKTDYDLPDYKLSAYQSYYEALKTALDENVSITPDEKEYTFDFTANGQKAIKALLKLVGIEIDGTELETYIGMVKEYKGEGSELKATVVATLTNTYEMPFEAAMVDIRNDAVKNKLDYTTDLVARAGEITGESLIVLLEDIEGELVLNHPTIIDLNGKKIDKLTANAKVLVLDSNLDNTKSGSIGSLSGSVYLTAGKYTDDVSAFVADGYKQNEDGFVQNALYTLEADENGNLSLTVDSGVIYENIDSYTQFAAAIASDIAADLIANYYTSAALYVADAGNVADNNENENGYNKIYDIDFNDFVKLIDSDSTPTEILNEALEVISLPDLADTINEIMQDLLDLDAIETAIRGGTEVASYSLQTQPWAVNLEHVYNTETGDDYLTCGIVANDDPKKANNITLTLTVDGPHNEKAADAVAFLSTIVMEGTRVELVDVDELTYEDKYFNLIGGAEFDVILDLSDYTTYMAIVMANGTDGDKRADLVNAVNSGNQNDLKAAFDVLTVKDVINALKVLQRNDDFATLASNVGMNVNINLEGKKELVEKVLIAGLAAAGKALEELEITGTEAKLGNLDKDGDGWYEYEAQYSRSGDVSRRGYGLNYNLTTADGYVKVNLFAEEYLLGDVNLDGKVTQSDMTMLARKVILNDAEVGEFNDIQLAVADTNQDGKLTQADVTLICRYAVLKDAELEWKPIYITI